MCSRQTNQQPLLKCVRRRKKMLLLEVQERSGFDPSTAETAACWKHKDFIEIRKQKAKEAKAKREEEHREKERRKT